jgi:hypothetical protein
VRPEATAAVEAIVKENRTFRRYCHEALVSDTTTIDKSLTRFEQRFPFCTGQNTERHVLIKENHTKLVLAQPTVIWVV